MRLLGLDAIFHVGRNQRVGSGRGSRQYTIDIAATNQGGSATLDVVRDVATGTPGQLTSPAPGTIVQGTTGFVFTPNSTFSSDFRSAR